MTMVIGHLDLSRTVHAAKCAVHLHPKELILSMTAGSICKLNSKYACEFIHIIARPPVFEFVGLDVSGLSPVHLSSG